MIFPQGGGPIFQQLAAQLRDHIRAGRIRPGQRLPSETTLQQQYGVNRLTARAAVNVLRAEGLAELRRGHGVVVREPPQRAFLEPPAGAVVTSRNPTLEERVELEIGEGTPVFSVTAPDGTVAIYPADRWQLRWPS